MNTGTILTYTWRWLLVLVVAGYLSVSAYGWWQSDISHSTPSTMPALAGPVDGGGNGG